MTLLAFNGGWLSKYLVGNGKVWASEEVGLGDLNSLLLRQPLLVFDYIFLVAGNRSRLEPS